ncbi:MAG: diguanylate cyclase [Sulfurimonas sp.]|uniref:diguanylate cyclase domain-containing protein n=1 Tax=Sulfurimonas sp. TaxID=2022749 RepID=UPI002608B728|nr:diguanylate cyclase [Sulfurimonas sp.]MDD2652684.1 diguanylate cyclase [Sulfurimonas sp.]MDD3450851.1 diguanylate cyclase [Sulfurimonas sp.]
MDFIDTLKSRSKLFSIFLIITLSLLVIGAMGTINLRAMKKNLDSLYFGSLVPIVELNSILQTYHDNLAGTLYRAKDAQVAPDELKSEIESAITLIGKEWKSYESHFKRDEELEYVAYTAVELQETNKYFLAVLKAFEDGQDMKNLSFGQLEKKVTHINQVIKKLIKYEIDIAKYERKNFLNIYESLLLKLGVLLVMVILGVMVVSYYVLKSIQLDQSALEASAKKLKIANKKLENASYTDSLTSLFNRRYFNLVYEREIKRAKRNHTFITFMMLDIDYFKQYNDMYGHIKGDAVLKQVASVFQDILKRPSDYVFRLGGEEFGVLLIDTSEISSANVADAICDAVRACEITHDGSKIEKYVTISIGVASCVADSALDEELLMARADEMLYDAKESGRNRYSITTNISAATLHEIEESA